MGEVPDCPMRVWIVNPYGTLPSEGWREYRSSLLARALADRGHEVTWWISDFEHRKKAYRTQIDLIDPLLPDGVRVIGVHCTGYSRNISLQRIRFESSYGREFARMAKVEVKPDVVVMGDPSLFFSASVLQYRDRVGCKLILDVIDLWPELFSVALPKIFQPFGRIIFSPLYRRRRNLVARCDGVVSVSQDYLRVALMDQHAMLPKLVSYLGVDVAKVRNAPLNSALDERLRQFRENHELIAVYAGTLGDAYDMDLLIDAVAMTAKQGKGIAFVVAGAGPRKSDIEACSKLYPKHLLFLGDLKADDLKTVYKNSDVGLMTYLPRSTVAMPVKFFDYLAGGLPVLNSLDRDVRQSIDVHRVGLNYAANDLSEFMLALYTMKTDAFLLQELREATSDLALKYDAYEQHKNFALFVERVCR